MTDAQLRKLRDDSGIAYAVVCDACNGRRYLNGLLCSKCDGDGTIRIVEAKPDFFKRLVAFLRKKSKGR